MSSLSASLGLSWPNANAIALSFFIAFAANLSWVILSYVIANVIYFIWNIFAAIVTHWLAILMTWLWAHLLKQQPSLRLKFLSWVAQCPISALAELRRKQRRDYVSSLNDVLLKQALIYVMLCATWQNNCAQVNRAHARVPSANRKTCSEIKIRDNA